MNDLVVKSNALVESSHKLNEVEQRLILLAILKAREAGNSVEQLKGHELAVYADDYAKNFGISRQMAYKAVKNAVMGLYRAEWGYRYINTKGNKAVRYERFAQSAEYVDGEGVVRFVFADAIIPHLVELERNFTAYEIAQVANLSSRHAMRLYECLKQYKATGKLQISLEDLRFRFGVLPEEYTRMSDFKKGVLDLAVNEINEHTDLKVDYTQQKRGRVITGFTFTFQQKTSADKGKGRDEKTPDIFTGLTDKQRAFFGRKLAELPELSHLAKGDANANYDAFGTWIANDLLNSSRLEFYIPYLIKVGYQA